MAPPTPAPPPPPLPTSQARPARSASENDASCSNLGKELSRRVSLLEQKKGRSQSLSQALPPPGTLVSKPSLSVCVEAASPPEPASHGPLEEPTRRVREVSAMSESPTGRSLPFQPDVEQNVQTIATPFSHDYEFLTKVGHDGGDTPVLLGEGGFGKTFLGYHTPTDKCVAIKMLSRISPGNMDAIMKEAQLLQMLDNDNIVRYLGLHVVKCAEGVQAGTPVVEEDVSDVYLVMEYCAQGTLEDVIKRLENKEYLLEEQILTWVVQLMEAANHLRLNNVLHRDITPRNIFLTALGDIRLGDFGISRIISDEEIVKSEESGSTTPQCYSNQAGTFAFIPPEADPGRQGLLPVHSFAMDMFSIGCVLFVICTKKRKNFSFDVSRPILFQKLREDLEGGTKHKYSKDLTDLILSMLDPEPAQRPTPDAVLSRLFIARHKLFRHPFIQSNLMYRHIRATVIPLFEKASKLIADISPHLNRPRDLDYKALLRSWSDSIIQIPVIGMIKAGKSTFINAFHGLESLPSSNEAETAFITHVRPIGVNETPSLEHAINPDNKKVAEGLVEVHVFLRNENKRRREEKTDTSDTLSVLDIVRHWEMDDHDMERLLAQNTFIANLHIPVLPMQLRDEPSPRVEIVDTPGVNENKMNFDLLIKGMMKRNACFIYLFDYSKLGSNDEARFLQDMFCDKKNETLEKHKTRMVFVVNKFDLYKEDSGDKDGEATKASIVRSVKDNVGIEINKDQVFLVSALDSLYARHILCGYHSAKEVKESSIVKNFVKAQFGRRATVENTPLADINEQAREVWAESGMDLVENRVFKLVNDMCTQSFVDVVFGGVMKELTATKRLHKIAYNSVMSMHVEQIAQLLEALQKSDLFSSYQTEVLQDLERLMRNQIELFFGQIDVFFRYVESDPLKAVPAPNDATWSDVRRNLQKILFDSGDVSEGTAALAFHSSWKAGVPKEVQHVFDDLGIRSMEGLWICLLGKEVETIEGSQVRTEFTNAMSLFLRKVYSNFLNALAGNVQKRAVDISMSFAENLLDPLLHALNRRWCKSVGSPLQQAVPDALTTGSSTTHQRHASLSRTTYESLLDDLPAGNPRTPGEVVDSYKRQERSSADCRSSSRYAFTITKKLASRLNERDFGDLLVAPSLFTATCDPAFLEHSSFRLTVLHNASKKLHPDEGTDTTFPSNEPQQILRSLSSQQMPGLLRRVESQVEKADKVTVRLILKDITAALKEDNKALAREALVGVKNQGLKKLVDEMQGAFQDELDQYWDAACSTDGPGIRHTMSSAYTRTRSKSASVSSFVSLSSVSEGSPPKTDEMLRAELKMQGPSDAYQAHEAIQNELGTVLQGIQQCAKHCQQSTVDGQLRLSLQKAGLGDLGGTVSQPDASVPEGEGNRRHSSVWASF